MKKQLIGILTIILVVGCSIEATIIDETAQPIETRTGNEHIEEGTAVIISPASTPYPTPMDLLLRPTDVEVTITPEEPPVVPISDPPTKSLNVCQLQLPDSLFLYSEKKLDKENIHHAIYENLYTTLDYDYQAQGLEKLPSLEDGDAVINPVVVQQGDLVVASNGIVQPLVNGVQIENSDGQLVTFDGQFVEMNQLEVNFSLKQMVWSDGTAVTADDSVFSFEINRDLQAPDLWLGDRGDRVSKTAVYEATGDLTLRWVGLPGYWDSTYFLNAWTPLPRHHLGDYPVDQLSSIPDSARTPLSSGPFVVEEWVDDNYIQLTKNPYYYRQEDGLPHVDEINFLFTFDSNWFISGLLDGPCDVNTNSGLNMGQAPSLIEAQERGDLIPYFFDGPIWEHITFGIDSVDSYESGIKLEDKQLRQAIALCTNRQRMIDEQLNGLTTISDSYLPNLHPFTPESLLVWKYDPDAGKELLSNLGYIDADGDNIREDVHGSPLQIRLNTTVGAQLRPALAELFVEDMALCEIDVIEDYLSGNRLFQSGPEGPILGRRFDLALFAWVISPESICTHWHSENIPREANNWQGNNISGWQNDEFDQQCDQATSFNSATEIDLAQKTAVQIFAEELPSLPLFNRVYVAATRPNVLNFRPNTSQPSVLWNIFEIDVEE